MLFDLQGDIVLVNKSKTYFEKNKRVKIKKKVLKNSSIFSTKFAMES